MQAAKARFGTLQAKYASLFKLTAAVTAVAGVALVTWWAIAAAPAQAQSGTEGRQPPTVRPGVVRPAPSTVGKISPSQVQIVGGGNAAIGELPWQVIVYPGPYLCGGTLIDVNWVVTAAHCVVDENGAAMSPGLVKVVAGEYRLASSDGTEQPRGVKQLYVHPSYDANSSDNDIALLHLDAPVTVGSSVGAIARVESPAQDNLAAPGVEAMVSGWGAVAEGGALADTVQKVRVPIVSNATCNSAYGGGISANMMCAGLAAGGKDSCQGDSGGPLVVPDGGGWRLAGVVSFGTGCAQPGFYGVYTRVAQYAGWIAGYVSGATPTPTPPTPTATSTPPPAATPTPAPTGTPNPTGTPAPTATANPSPAGNQVRNGTFEEGSNGDWSESSSTGYDLILPRSNLGGMAPHAGDWAAWLGGNNDEESTLTQDVVLNGQGIALRFYYQIDSEDECGFDTATVRVEALPDLAAAGATQAQAVKSVDFELCQDNATGTWEQAEIDMGPFAGGTVRLTFSAKTDGSLYSSLFVDDATITAAAPAATPAPTPQGLPLGANRVYLPLMER